MAHKLSISPSEITRLENGNRIAVNDFVSVEEPIEIRIITQSEARIENPARNLAITMRTPGDDAALATGFLFTEGIIVSSKQIQHIASNPDQSSIVITLEPGLEPILETMDRHFYTTSSCGVCGKASIDAVQIKCKIALPQTQWKISETTLFELPQTLRSAQENFDHTGGLHACALFTLSGQLIDLKEDVGRHNALDKLIGQQIASVPLSENILMLSGRISFELVQKAAMAGIRMIAAVGAPSSLAIDLAEELGITLVGFLRGNRCNIYCNPQRIT